MTTRKPIDKDYLLEALKSFNFQVLKNTYATSSEIKEFEEDIKEFIEKIELSNGKNVQVAKIEPIIGGNRVTFTYYDNSNVQQISSMEVMNGENGISIVGANIADENVLTLELSDGQTIIAGKITVNSDELTLNDYYTKEQVNDKFVQKVDLNTLIQNYLDSTFQRIGSEEINNIFRKGAN